ncbi:MAG: hypothetical protein FWF28_10225, partial [Micrococcales bacterium]|nr:hypothetical protein [Micrococcales bacterium]
VTYRTGDAAPGGVAFAVTRTDETGRTSTVAYAVTVLAGPASPAPSPLPTPSLASIPAPTPSAVRTGRTVRAGSAPAAPAAAAESFVTGGALVRGPTSVEEWSAAGAGLLAGAAFLAVVGRRRQHT